MTCTGNVLEYCGGPSKLDLYMLNTTSVVPTSTPTPSNLTSVSTSPTAVSTSSTRTSSTSSTATPSGPFTVTNVAGWNYLGCYSEGRFLLCFHFVHFV